MVQACLLCIAILSSLLTSEYARSEVIGLNGLPDPGSGQDSRLVLDVLLTAATFAVPAIVMAVQVRPAAHVQRHVHATQQGLTWRGWPHHTILITHG